MKFFVTATDTDAGKTLISCGLLNLARQKGLSTLGLKPVAAGAEDLGEGLQNSDALALQAESSLEPSYAEVNPLVFKAAIAPHLAAAEEGRRLNLDRLAGLVRGQLFKKADLTLVEGAGGWRVPLQGRQTLAELPKLLNLPVILVVRMQLGCLNHALLTAEAIQRDGLLLAGWVANNSGEPMDREEDNFQTLQQLLPAPCLGRVPRLEEASAEVASQYLNLPGSA
ncbi:dethiobiotin synthetase [Marinospirillum celere]|uniref:ATP-dependent dethiobiotin synthetase BioD n=1 Tax=Marinospirillum celere TaxID=1122252 RepID=A0A1I1DZS9_9GAMM|nr:dethiobiotin synthase [Marinospirillum celere]SFB79936.1 dethiobiotin synthetase [Marinospirillum celere]